AGDQHQAVPATRETAGVLGAEPGAGTRDQRCARHGPEASRIVGPPTAHVADQPSLMVIRAILSPSRSKRNFEGPLAWDERQSPTTVTDSPSVSTSLTVNVGAEPMNWTSLQAWSWSKPVSCVLQSFTTGLSVNDVVKALPSCAVTASRNEATGSGIVRVISLSCRRGVSGWCSRRWRRWSGR